MTSIMCYQIKLSSISETLKGDSVTHVTLNNWSVANCFSCAFSLWLLTHWAKYMVWFAPLLFLWKDKGIICLLVFCSWLTTTVMSLSRNGYCPLVHEVNECSSMVFSFTKAHHGFRMTVMSFEYVGHCVQCVTNDLST